MAAPSCGGAYSRHHTRNRTPYRPAFAAIFAVGGGPLQHRTLDLVIAATAITHDLEVVTRNTRDYQDVPGLRLYQPPVSA